MVELAEQGVLLELRELVRLGDLGEIGRANRPDLLGLLEQEPDVLDDEDVVDVDLSHAFGGYAARTDESLLSRVCRPLSRGLREIPGREVEPFASWPARSAAVTLVAMEPLAGIPLVALAVVVLAATSWAALTTERRIAWSSTAAFLWAGAACFTILALAGAQPVAMVVLGWTLIVGGLLTATLALAGPRAYAGLARVTRPRAPIAATHAR